MERGYEIFGKNPEPRARGYLEERRREALKPLEGEPPKTAEELKFIEKLNGYLRQEFEELGLPEKPEILPEEIHLLPHEVYAKRFPRRKAPAFSDPMDQVVYVDKDTHKYDEGPSLYMTITHEALGHLASFRSYHSERRGWEASTYRFGYRIHQPYEASHEHFRGVDEAVIERMVLDDIWGKHRRELLGDLGIRDEELEGARKAYAGEIRILDEVTQRIAEKKNEAEGTVWRRFKRGLFTGEMMHLRDVEETFGKGSLRVLAALGSGTKELPREEINQKILRYFQTEDEKERERIAKEVLVERERLRYEKRRS